MIKATSEHQRTRACASTCWACALRDTERASSEPGSEVDLQPLWANPLESIGVTFEEQHDPLEILLQLGPQDTIAFQSMWADHFHDLKHHPQCSCPFEMPVVTAAPVRRVFAALTLPPFDDCAAIALNDLLDKDPAIVPDGGLPCPHCSQRTSLTSAESWHLGPVALLQVVRETGLGQLNRTAVFAPPEFERGNYVYFLRAAVLHRGQSFDSGHYVAFLRQSNGAGWVQYNDGDRPKRLPREPPHLQTHSRYFLYERAEAGFSDSIPA